MEVVNEAQIAKRVISGKTVGVLAQCEYTTMTVCCCETDMSTVAQNAIDIIDYGREPTEVDYAHMIQSFHRFLLDRLTKEGNLPAHPHIF